MMTLLGNLRLVSMAAAGLAALSVVGWIAWLRADNASLRQERAALRSSLAASEQALADQTRATAALEASEARLEAAARAARKARSDALSAPDRDDAPLAPVLARALEALRETENEEGE